MGCAIAPGMLVGHLKVFTVNNPIFAADQNQCHAQFEITLVTPLTNAPRMLLIDMTSMSGSAATSMLKSAYFSDWEAGKLLHLQSSGWDGFAVSANNGPAGGLPDKATALALVESFRPELIFYRPVADRPELHTLAMQIIELNDVPLALWLMDDWPARLEAADADAGARMDNELRTLFGRSSQNYAISEGMAEVFGTRYGVTFDLARNGVLPEHWPEFRRGPPKKKIILRYAGSLAPDTTCDTVYKTAKAVAELASNGIPIRFEIRTQATWLESNAGRFGALQGVTIGLADQSVGAYRKWLSSADILLLAYNFCDATRRYLQYSFANKTPELLASGTAVLAIGPEELETIKYLRQHNLAKCVIRDELPEIRKVLQQLCTDAVARIDLGRIGRRHALEEMDLRRLKENMTAKLSALALESPSPHTEAPSSSDLVQPLLIRPNIYRRFINGFAEKAPWLFRFLQIFVHWFRRPRRTNQDTN
jgi:hypothetical protein